MAVFQGKRRVATVTVAGSATSVGLIGLKSRTTDTFRVTVGSEAALSVVRWPAAHTWLLACHSVRLSLPVNGWGRMEWRNSSALRVPSCAATPLDSQVFRHLVMAQ